MRGKLTPPQNTTTKLDGIFKDERRPLHLGFPGPASIARLLRPFTDLPGDGLCRLVHSNRSFGVVGCIKRWEKVRI
jgi:hypothetical protein